MDFDFSKYKIYIPKISKVATLYEPEHVIRLLDKEEIYLYDEGIKIVQKNKMGLWLSDDIVHNKELHKKVVEYFQKMGIIAD